MSYEEICRECGRKNTIIYDPSSGRYCCTKCGLVVGQEYAQCQERAYTPEEAAKRLHHGINEHSNSLQKGSEFSYTARYDSKGNFITADQKSLFRRLVKANERGYTYKERKLAEGIMELKRIRSQLALSQSIFQCALVILGQSIELKIDKGKSVEALAAASLIIASRQTNHMAVVAREIMSVANSSDKSVSACVRIILRELKFKYVQFDLRKLCLNICERLNLTMETVRGALNIIDLAQSAGLTIGKHPASLAAAAVYIAVVQTGEHRTQQQVAEAALTTPVTIRNRFKEIVEILKLDNVKPSRGVGATPVYRKRFEK